MKTKTALLMGFLMLSATATEAQTRHYNLGAYVGVGLDRTNDAFKNRFTVSSSLNNTDISVGRSSFGTYLTGGYAFGSPELNAALDLTYHLGQDKAALFRFPPSGTIQSFGENGISAMDISFKPSIQISKGTNFFVRLGLSQTTSRLFYRDANLATVRKNYRAKGWLWGFGVESHLTPSLAVAAEYRTVSPHSVSFSSSDPFIQTVTSGFSAITESANLLRVQHKIDSFSIGMIYYMG